MSIDVAACIGELLYTHSSVIIPGVGGFMAKYQEAAIDQIQGQIAPPSTTINFNGNLVTNDGVLINHIKNKYNISYEDSKSMVEKFVADTQVALNNRKTIVLPKVGKLYKDYKDETQFLTDHQNFNPDAFGLPPVAFYPVLRDKKPPVPTPSAASQKASTAPIHNTSKAASANWLDRFDDWFQVALPYIAAIVLVIVALTVYFVLRNDSKSTPPIADNTESDIRINKKPNTNKDAQTSISSEDDDEIIDDFDSEVNTIDEEEDEYNIGENKGTQSEVNKNRGNSEGSTIRPGQKSAIIIVGGFSSRTNAQKRAEEIYKAGYEAYIDKKKNLHRVGILFPYETEEDVNKVLRFAKRKFDKAAWILPE